MKPLSPEMLEAIDFARDHGGKLVRHQGGFWADENWCHGKQSYGTTTVEGIVKRGSATYSKWKQTGHRPFPIEATINRELQRQ